MSGCIAKERDINFFIPLEVIKSSTGDMRIGGVATDENGKDIQGEKVLVAGMDTSYLLERGAFNWDHGKGPGSILGEVDIVQKDLDKGQLYVEGFLYKGVDEAQKVYNLMKGLKESGSKRKLGLSVEGKVKERDTTTGKIIKSSWIKNIAVTYNPINSGTFVDMVKSLGNFTYSQCTGKCDGCATLCEMPENKSLSEEGVNKAQPTKDEVATVSKSPEVKSEGSKLSTQEESPVLDKAVVPSSDNIVEKAGMSAGYDAPATSGGISGSAVREEDLDKKDKVTTFDKKKKKIKKSELKGWFEKMGYTDKMAEIATELIFKARDYQEELIKPDQLNKWLQSNMNYSPRLAELMTDAIFKSIEVKGYLRTRKGKLERVKPFTKEFLHELHRIKTMSDPALERRAMKVTHPDKLLHFFHAAKHVGKTELAGFVRGQGKRLGLEPGDFESAGKFAQEGIQSAERMLRG